MTGQDDLNDQSESEETPEAPDRKSGLDRWVRLGFLAALLIVVAVLVVVQRKPPWKGWADDLNKALGQARQAKPKRQLLVFFTSDPPGEPARRMRATTLKKSHNKRAIEKGNFIRVRVAVRKLDSPEAKKYGIRKLPTMLVLSHQGRELNRREGFIGEVDFASDFLDCRRVEKP